MPDRERDPVPDLVVDDGSPDLARGERTERSLLRDVEREVKTVVRRTHPARVLVGSLVALVVAIAGVVGVIESVATKGYVDAKVAPLVRDRELMIEMLGWQRAIGQALGVPRPIVVQMPQERADAGSPVERSIP